MKLTEIANAVLEGNRAVDDARALRKRLRRASDPTDPGRQKTLADARERIRVAMVPIRSLRGRLLWDPQPDDKEAAVRAVSEKLQYEAKQLKKMQR